MNNQKDHRTDAKSSYNLEQIGGRYGPWINYEDNTPANGRYISEFENGMIEKERNFRDGEQHGLQRVWWPDGNLRSEKEIKNGLGQGYSRCWHFNGQLARECLMDEGNFIGSYRTWSENGVLTWDQPWKDGEMHGTQMGWNEDGSLLWLTLYCEGTSWLECYDFKT